MGPYRVANVAIATRAVYTNRAPAGAFRGFGVPQAAIAHETLLDDLAERLGLDRWTIRQRNALRVGDVTASGQRLAHSAGLPQCLAALRGDWEAALARVAAHNAPEPRHRRGVGLAAMWYGCGNTSVSNPSTMRITLARDGTLTFLNGAVDIGQGSSTVLSQIAAAALGLPVGAFRMLVGDTQLTADAGKTSASRQTLVSGNATRLAALALRGKILALANAGPDARLSLAGSRLQIWDGEASRSVDLANLAALHAAAGAVDHRDDLVLDGVGSWDPPTTALDANGQGVPYFSCRKRSASSPSSSLEIAIPAATRLRPECRRHTLRRYDAASSAETENRWSWASRAARSTDQSFGKAKEDGFRKLKSCGNRNGGAVGERLRARG